MKIKEGFILRNVADNYIVISVGEKTEDFNGMITLNETGAFLWKLLSESDTNKDELIKQMTAEYDVDENTAEEDIDDFIKKLTDTDLLVI